MEIRKIRQLAIAMFLVCCLRVMASGDGIHQGTMIQQRHEEWMSKYNRKYESTEDKTKRFQIFKENAEKMDAVNKLGRGFVLKENQFADLTDEEFSARHREILETSSSQSQRSSPPAPPRMSSTPSPRKLSPPPRRKPPPPPPRRKPPPPPPPRRFPPPPSSSFDWRSVNAVTPVKNGTACAAGWAYAITATIEAITKVKTGTLKALSAQELVDCSNSEWACRTAPPYEFLMRVFEYLLDYGVHSETEYPYTGEYELCKKITTVPTRISNFSYVTPNNETALEIAVRKQPVVARLYRSELAIRFYNSGIFEGPCGENPNEYYGDVVVALIGFGKQGNKKYWIAKNSWGVNWGESGYIRIRKDVSDPKGVCELAKLVYYPIA